MRESDDVREAEASMWGEMAPKRSKVGPSVEYRYRIFRLSGVCMRMKLLDSKSNLRNG